MMVVSGVSCVERLTEVVGLTSSGKEDYDWAIVEDSLGGLALPDDYKALVRAFPPGTFQRLVKVIRPGDARNPKTEYLGYYKYRLEDMRGAREDPDDPATFPHPIFPEPGGLLPWGVGTRSELFFWVTGSADPNKWTVAWADEAWTEWRSFSGTMCEFLIELVSGRLEGLPVDDKGRKAIFEPEKPSRPQLPALEPVWSPRRQQPGNPVSDLDELAGVMPRTGSAMPGQGWHDIERHVGYSLPADYKAFVESFGSGVFCDLVIADPYANDEKGLVRLLAKKHDQAVSSRRLPGVFPFFPEPLGLIAWGETLDGFTCCWAPSSDDPGRWGVAVTDPKLRKMEYSADLSFTSFLLRYCGHRDPGRQLLGREPWHGEVTFAPHHSRSG